MAQKKVPSEFSHLRANPFYVGSRKVITHNKSWCRPTLTAAVKHAESLVNETGEDQFVVKVVRIVRRKPAPTIVEKL